MGAYSLDLRERVLTDLDEGMSKASLARKYRVSTRWSYKLQKQRDQTGDIKPRKGRCERGHRGRWRQTRLPTALQSGFKSDRTGVCQA